MATAPPGRGSPLPPGAGRPISGGRGRGAPVGGMRRPSGPAPPAGSPAPAQQTTVVQIDNTSKGKAVVTAAPADGNQKQGFIATFWKGTVAEFVATALFVFCCCAAVTASAILDGKGHHVASDMMSYRLLFIGICQGLALVGLGFSTIFDGDNPFPAMNPAVVVACVLTRRTGILRGVLYIAAELVGSVFGAFFVWWIYPNAMSEGMGGTTVEVGFTPFHATLMEVVISLFLVLVIFQTVVVPARTNPTIAPLAVGLTVTVGVLLGGPVSGGSMNPARSFGPAVISGYWCHHYVYWVGPLCGAVFAAVLYEMVLGPKKQ